jgi:pimeloyl-ACP methyl ester carboxylesterase
VRTHPLMAQAEFGEDEFVDVGGRWIHYVEAGRGTPVILVPGSFSTYRVWNPILPILAKEYRPIAMDRPGAGDSDKPMLASDYSIGGQAELLAQFVRALRLVKPHAVGASTGGTILLSLAARHPEGVGKIVCIGGGVIPPRPRPGGRLEKWLRYPVLGDAVVALIRTGWFNRTALEFVAGEGFGRMTRVERERALRDLSYATRSAARPAWYWTGRSAATLVPFTEEAKKIRVPVLYFAGRQTGFPEQPGETVRFLQEHLPRSKVLPYDAEIQDFHLQRPYEVVREIVDFLAA